MTATALIVSWNSAPDLTTCLSTLPPDTPVVLVDNASADASATVGQAWGADVVPSLENRGFAAAVNLGLKRVRTEYVALINPDVLVGHDVFERLEVVLRTAPDVGIVGPNTRLPDGRPEPPAARRDRTALHILLESFGLVHLSRRFDLQMVQDRSLDRDVDAVNGAFLMMRTAVLRDLGGLDESVFMYLEDQDLCRRVRDAGYRVRFVADAPAVHGNGTSTSRGSEDQQVRAYLHRIDADLEFLRRYGRPGEAGLAVAALILRALVGLLVSIARPQRRSRYRHALGYTIRQIRDRSPAPPV